MKSHINTRSVSKDYRYLGEQPDSGWLADYKDLTSFEHPTIIFEKDDNAFRLFLSGMPSTRKDKVGTIIRYSFLFTGSLDEYQQVAGLVSAWAAAIDDNSNITQKLGELYGEDEVLAMIESGVFDDSAQLKFNEWLGTFRTTNHVFAQKISEVMNDNASSAAVSYLNFVDDEQDLLDIKPKKQTDVWLHELGKFVRIQKVDDTARNTATNTIKKPKTAEPITDSPTKQQSKSSTNVGKRAAMIIVLIIVIAIIAVALNNGQS